MKMFDPSLGTFSLLPPEIRLMIWEYFSPHLHVGELYPTKPNQLRQDREILLLSRKIYAEVAAEIPFGQNDNTIVISIRPNYREKTWMKVRNRKGMMWVLEDLRDARNRGFLRLPWHNLNVRILIYAPRRNNKAEVIALFKKVQTLASALPDGRWNGGFLSLWVVFTNLKETSWFDGARPQQSFKDRNPLPGAQWDYQFIFLLFHKIGNVKEARMYCTEVVEGKRKDQVMGEAFTNVAKMMMEKPLERWWVRNPYGGTVSNIRLTIQMELEVLPPSTADRLRGGPYFGHNTV